MATPLAELPPCEKTFAREAIGVERGCGSVAGVNLGWSWGLAPASGIWHGAGVRARGALAAVPERGSPGCVAGRCRTMASCWAAPN
jgi:hypothetical protein